ncbi:beta-lactamase family protein [Pseudomaricurvus alkylphenolicus]|uniref:serine hydrolase domain-containing protein n=1 Tax=Pseudomaricurvus alkylphenolicus TaxID=1306991 RepID=UPI00141F4C96|nr:serine hydrolase domain-containing protein [Pseudomaricurvus alkylphenolicus]NIB38480.1 beta-lactamase family protein [Pseudomaricurvus alkylphenolicus]
MSIFSDTTLLVSMLLAVVLISGCSSIGSNENKISFPSETSLLLQKQLDTASVDQSAIYPGSILRIQTLAGIWEGTTGVANVVNRDAVVPAAKFRAGSILKPFIATVVLQLMEEKKLSLDDRLTDFLPHSTTRKFNDSASITLKMLLNHTSGIGDWTGSNSEEEKELYEAIFRDNQQIRPWPVEELLEMAASQGQYFDAGSQWQYNNTGYNLLGLVIEKVTGQSWRDNIRQRVLAPLDLKNTFLPESGHLTMSQPFISGYSDFSGEFTDTTEVDPSLAGAAGGHALVTNTEDLSIFIRALLDGVLFRNQETLSKMLSFVDMGEAGSAYGLGIQTFPLPNGGYAIGHGGMTAGYRSVVFHLPKEDITVASVLSAHQGAGFDFLLPTLKIVKEHLKTVSKKYD